MSDKFDTKGLDNLIKAFGGRMPVIQVGVLGDSSKRTKGPSNAEIGYRHEIGDGVPQRSWLRQPIQNEFGKAVKKADFFKKAMKETASKGTIIQLFGKLAVLVEGVVLEGFNSGGYGKWKPSNMHYKKNHQTLVETQQLRNAVLAKVVE